MARQNLIVKGKTHGTKTQKSGDRFDGCWLRDEAPALGQFVAYLMPNRADNEAHINADIDCRPLDAYLVKKNERLTEDKYTYFHIFLAAIVKCFVLCPRMNRFISDNRLYMRDHSSVSFVIKKKFEDKSATCKEMAANIEKCARSLRTIGVRENDRVTIAMPNCLMPSTCSAP